MEEVEVCSRKVSRGKTEYMCVDEKETGLAVKLQGLEVVKVDEIPGVIPMCTREVKKRVQEGADK